MADQQLNIIKDNPIGNGLDAFRASFSSVCEGAGVLYTPDALEQLGQEDLQNLALDLLIALQSLRVSRQLRSSGRDRNLLSDLSRLNSAVNSDDFDLDYIKPLLKCAIADNIDDALIWDRVYRAYRKDVDRVLRNELGAMYVGLPRFYEAFFGRVVGLEMASEAVFNRCTEGSEPLFSNGWRGWPTDANQDDVLSWFAELTETLATFAEEYKSISTHRRRPLAQPNKPIQGSTAERKLDVGFVDDPKAGKDSRCHWSHILIPGELKSNPSADKAAKAWLDLGTYAREVLAVQDTRRFVLGFTICGSLMRIWEFDRLGGIASEQFDINEDGLQLVSIVLGFLWMGDEELGFDTTIMTANDKRFIKIERNGSTERLIIDKVMQRGRCIAGRATTYSWQYPERDEEGELLRQATSQGVVNVARYYHHETVQIRGTEDDIRNNVRRRLDVTRATNYRPERSMPPPSTIAASASRKGRSSSATSKKRSSSQTGAALPPSKRTCSVSPTKASVDALPNRVHRRVILRDYGKPIYMASSRSALLAALEGCIEGHESLRNAGFLHTDISTNNLMINEDNNLSWPSFLIDLDLAVREQREGASGAKGKTGTRAFMAIGALLGEQHSFMHDLESFFWVLFWICIHYDAQGKDIRPTGFDDWNYENDDKLVRSKMGEISDEEVFLAGAEKNFTSYYRPLIPWVNRLRRKVFPNGGRWKRLEQELYSSMKEILRKARNDPEVLEDR
ncbi:hypothetical protein B0T26DRAFT_810694 [Lasiosphaeria miniovina]|uniref:non-specific serine/threonine protein kinase n=1 Tax=Lasiosphaeria miniovina TaxID=1954250 RepID=A0AA40E8E3_9PEZI|nr:uncharacterized protein B0T26DRAFT_810694 [Lasiosphaeria miniovina]KAK0728902.1 hypothetical protein B0T26DRAFT_810694 [Lasiosphaeria miniovina]